MDPQTDEDPTGRLGLVVGVDGTWTALRAVDWAVAEARLRGLPLRILHAAPYATGPTGEPGRRRAGEILARAFTVARRADPSLAISTRYTEDGPVPTLLAAAARARLLVVGMGGGERPQEILIGSTALAVSGHAPCPVVVVRGRHRTRTSERPVLVGVDISAVEGAVLTVAYAEARRHGCPLVVLHARHGAGPLREHLAGTDETAHAEYGNRLADELEPWSARYPDVPVELEVVRAHPSTALLGAAARARLVVVGSRGRSAPARALFGSTSREVLRQCPVPVEIVPAGATITDDEPGPPAAMSTAGPDDPHDRSQLW